MKAAVKEGNEYKNWSAFEKGPVGTLNSDLSDSALWCLPEVAQLFSHRGSVFKSPVSVFMPGQFLSLIS